MRCTVFDKNEIKWLEALGFTVAEDGESAELRSGEITISVVLPYHEDFIISVELPGGQELRSFLWRNWLERAADVDEDEEENGDA